MPTAAQILGEPGGALPRHLAPPWTQRPPSSRARSRVGPRPANAPSASRVASGCPRSMTRGRYSAPMGRRRCSVVGFLVAASCLVVSPPQTVRAATPSLEVGAPAMARHRYVIGRRLYSEGDFAGSSPPRPSSPSTSPASPSASTASTTPSPPTSSTCDSPRGRPTARASRAWWSRCERADRSSSSRRTPVARPCSSSSANEDRLRPVRARARRARPQLPTRPHVGPTC